MHVEKEEDEIIALVVQRGIQSGAYNIDRKIENISRLNKELLQQDTQIMPTCFHSNVVHYYIGNILITSLCHSTSYGSLSQ